MSSSPPTTLGKYQIIREIARSNDIVYEGYDAAMNRRVAVKELNIPHGSSPQQREERIRRFHREIKAAGSLAHPGIVTIYEVGQEGDRHFMAMEYLDGKTLRNELDTNGLLPEAKALEIAIAVLEALDYAHQNGVIHRDIKPENVQILSSGRIKLTDFGIARLTFEPNLTQDGQVFGTPSYMSPEQVVGKEIDARSDLFSVGALLYEMLSGQKAFAGDSVVSISYAIMNNEVQGPQGASYSSQQVVRGLLEKAVALRYATASAAVQAAQSALDALRNGNVVLPNVQPSSTLMGGYPNVVPQPPPGSAPPAYPHTGYPAQHVPPPPPYTYGYQPPPQTPIIVPIPGQMMPPRPPLFKPETKAAFGRFLVIVISLSLVFGVLIVGIQSLARAADQMGQRRGAGPSQATGAGPVDRENAVRFYQNAEALMRSGDLAGAESNLLEAQRLDPNQAAFPRLLGSVYEQRALRESDASLSLNWWQRSSAQWQRAAELEPDPTRKARFTEGAATALYNGAIQIGATGDRTMSRRVLYEALRLAPSGSAIRNQIEQQISALTQ